MNYSRFRRLVSLLLAVLVLTASVGLTVQKHTCRFSGRSRVQVALPGHAPMGCGSFRPASARLKSSCCSFDSKLHKLTVPAHAQAKSLLSGPLLAAWLPVAGWLLPLTVNQGVGVARQIWFAADSSSPPLAGRRLLAFVGMLVV